jgi:DNA-binding response OmpR family regulator
VEDEGHLRQAVVKMLRKVGFEVFEAADGPSEVDPKGWTKFGRRLDGAAG